MKIVARTTYTVNDGPEKTEDIELTVADDFKDNEVNRYSVGMMAADKLVEKGQIMIAKIEILPAATAKAVA